MLGEDQRKEMVIRELSAYETAGSEATYSVLFRGSREYLPVIKVDPRSLILNPKNNRLHGQLEDHPSRSTVLLDPASTSSQRILHSLLAETPEFKKLKEQLKELGQREPGLITRDGLLVNGNTRVAALCDLGINHVEVAVLPENATEADVLDIEMDLQVTDLVHQDYSFTNELLLMRRYLDNGASYKDLAKKMGWINRGVAKVEASMRLLSMIEEVRKLAPSKIKYAEFDSKSQHLKDLDSDYERLKAEGDINGAESLKWTRLSALFLGLNKDQVRAIDADFLSNNLLPRLDKSKEEHFDVLEHLDRYSNSKKNHTIDPLFNDDTDSTSDIDMRLFLRDYLNREAEPEGNELEGIYATVAFAARRTAERIIDEQKLNNARAEPSEVLIEFRERLATLHSNIPEIANDERFKPDKFLFQLEKVQEELDKIASAINKAHSVG